MSRTCLCLSSNIIPVLIYRLRVMEGSVGLGGWLRSETVRWQSPIPLLTGLEVAKLR